MVTFWCSWCGNTATRETRDETVRCGRCVEESMRLFRYWPWTVMMPLDPGQEAPEPYAARKRFVFREVRTGEVVRTDVVRPPKLRAVPI